MSGSVWLLMTWWAINGPSGTVPASVPTAPVSPATASAPVPTSATVPTASTPAPGPTSSPAAAVAPSLPQDAAAPTSEPAATWPHTIPMPQGLPRPTRAAEPPHQIGDVVQPTLWLVGLLILGAIGIGLLKKLHKPPSPPRPEEELHAQLAAFRSAHLRGEMTDEEFAKVKAMLVPKLKELEAKKADAAGGSAAEQRADQGKSGAGPTADGSATGSAP